MTTSNEHNNAPAVPQGEPEAYMVYGNYTRQPFRSIESAQAYMGGLLKSDPEGGYHIRPLFYATPAAPSQEPAVPQGFKPVGYLRSDEFDGHVFEPIDGTWPFDELLFSLSEPVQEVTLTDEERADMACAVAAICTGTSSRTVAATAIEWTERALRAKGQP